MVVRGARLVSRGVVLPRGRCCRGGCSLPVVLVSAVSVLWLNLPEPIPELSGVVVPIAAYS